MHNREEILARRGLTLPRQVLKRLSSVGIVVKSAVSLEYQHLAGRYVVRGVESGGAVMNLGRYVTFCGPEGGALPYLHPLDSIVMNGVHAVVVAPILVRIELFRTGRTCQLLISQHQPGTSQNGRRPLIESRVLFRGVDGFVDLAPLGDEIDSHLPEALRFWSRSGEDFSLPPAFSEAVVAAILGVHCVGCSHAHFLKTKLNSRIGASTL